MPRCPRGVPLTDPPSSPPRFSVDELLRDSLAFLVAFSLGELVLNRTVSRATIFISKGPTVEAALAFLASVGLFLLALAFLLGLLWLLLVGGRGVTEPGRSKRDRIGSWLLLALTLLGGFSLLDPGPPVTFAFVLLFAAFVALWTLSFSKAPRLWIGLALAIAAAYILHATSVALSALASAGGGLGLWAEIPQRLGEVSVLVAAVLLFVREMRVEGGGWRLDVRTAAIAAVPAAAFAFAAALNVTMVANVLLWSVGYTLFLTAPVYAGALWCFAVAVLAAWRDGRRTAAYAWLLILAAGYNLNLTHLYFLAAIGLVLLAEEGRLTPAGPSDSRPPAPPPETVS